MSDDDSVANATNASACPDSGPLLEVLPAEIWQMILGKLGNDDLERCCNASAFFRQLLDSERVLILFPKVWELLEKTVYKNTDRSTNNNTEGVNNNSPVETPALPSNSFQEDPAGTTDEGVGQILKLRLVCQSWAKAFDEFYQRRLLYGNTNEVAYGKFIETTFHPVDFHHRDANADLTPQFLAKFGQSHGTPRTNQKHEASPFLSRTVELNYHSCNIESLAHSPNLVPIFESYGHSLNKLTVNYKFNMSMFDAQPNFRQCLALMDNLKCLELKVCVPCGTIMAMRDTPELSAIINSNPFSRMEKLEFLSLRNVSIPFFEHFVRVNNQVTRLKLCKTDGVMYEIFSIPLPNLIHLEIWSCDETELERLTTANFSPNFQKLEIVNVRPIRQEKVFSIVGAKWGDTLTHFSLFVLLPKKLACIRERYVNIRRKEYPIWQKKYLPHVTELNVDFRFTSH